MLGKELTWFFETYNEILKKRDSFTPQEYSTTRGWFICRLAHQNSDLHPDSPFEIPKDLKDL